MPAKRKAPQSVPPLLDSDSALSMSLEPPDPTIRIAPRLVLRVLLVIVTLLVVIHIAVHWCWRAGGCGPVTQLFFYGGYLFDLNAELNIPTWYAVIQLASVALSLGVVARIESKNGKNSGRWWGLMIVFFYLSLDEATDLHGLSTAVPGGPAIPGVYPGFNWIIPGAAIVLLVAGYYLPWVLRLERRTRNLFLLAGAVYVTGELVLEAVGAFVADESFMNLSYIIVSTAEEALGLYGIAIMLYAVLRHLSERETRIVYSAGAKAE